MEVLTRLSTGTLCPSRAQNTSTTHWLPTVTLGSRWSRASLQKVRGSGSVRRGSSLGELWKHPKDSWGSWWPLGVVMKGSKEMRIVRV